MILSRHNLLFSIHDLTKKRVADEKMLNVGFNNGTCRFTDNQNDELDGIDYPSQQTETAARIANNYRNNHP